jgi:WD40 repeat protein
VNDGKLICTGGEDGTLRLWNPKSGQCKAVFEPRHESEEAVTCVHSDGDIIAAGNWTDLHSSLSIIIYELNRLQ